ncbi:hypothetical protein L6452_14525 [Arctium lappa]|uniref:Uncharacterized protein n=1 Tax=Arctium lappa TaxID=4217 RepID=A0ACB9CL44_ARCLA|nr:hypothetical protein L6452_14525 [Arctium lappa]
MEEAELEKQGRMVTKSSIKRKPFANLTNVVRKHHHTSSFSKPKTPGSSTASDSSIGTTQSGIHVVPSTPQRLTPELHFLDHLVGDENHLAYARRWSAQKTRSNVKAAVQETRSNGQGNQSCLDKTTNDGKEKSAVLQCSSMEKIKDKRKATDVPFSAHRMKNAKTNTDAVIPHSTVKIKDKGKENVVQSSYSSMQNTNINMSFIMPPLMKRKDKGKAIAEPLDYPPMKKVKNNMVEMRVPLSGVKIKDRGETVTGSSHVDLAQKDEGKAVSTPINYRTLEKKDKGRSCPPLLRTSGNRNEADEAEDILQSNPQTDPPLNKKTKRCSSTKGVKEYALPQDFVEQQRAYFKEIDEFELEVEEV